MVIRDPRSLVVVMSNVEVNMVISVPVVSAQGWRTLRMRLGLIYF